MDARSFYFLSPEEFEIIYQKWSEKRDAELRISWEQTRKICYWSVYKLKTVLTIENFMPLVWDKEKAQGKKVKDLERYERLKERYGETTP